MVHRPADSRLLANLITNEKDYSKHLHALFPLSHTALASLSAYASASPSSPAHALTSLVDILAGVDDAFQRYTSAVDKWREELTALKALEDEVGDVLRDREILVTRLIKASKTSKRDSRPPFSMRNSETDSFSSTPSNVSSNTKLSHAQAELSACEAHLAAKEQELEARRISAIRDGLGHRCRALVDCGWVMGEMGKDGLRALQELGGLPNGHAPNGSAPFPSASPSPNASNKPNLPYLSPTPIPAHLQSNNGTGVGSDISSLTPSQSASQIFVRGSEDDHHVPASPTAKDAHEQEDVMLHIPPAHSMSELDLPTGVRSPARALSPLAIPNGAANGSTASLPAQPVQRRPTQNGGKRQRRPLSRRITEVSEGEEEGPVAGGSYFPRRRDRGEASSSDDEAQLGPLRAVDNDPFARGGASGVGTGAGAGLHKRFTLRHHTIGSASDVASSPVRGSEKEKKGSGFFGSIKGLFGKKDGKKESQRVASAQQAFAFSDWETATEPPAPPSRAKAGMGRWATRTDANVKASRRRGDGESSGEEEFGPSGTVKGKGKGKGRAGGGGAKLKKHGAGWASEDGGADREATVRRKKSAGLGAAGVSGSMRRRAVSQQAGSPAKAPVAGHARAKSTDVVVVEPDTTNLSRSASTKNPAVGGGSSVSRNNSLSKGSIMSAPATLHTGAAPKKAKRVTVDGDTFVQPVAGKHASAVPASSSSAPKPAPASNAHPTPPKPPAETNDGTPKRSSSMRSNASAATHTSTNTASDFRAKNRAQKARTMPPPAKPSASANVNGSAETSLMSIVEDVSRLNRAGWAHAKDATRDAGEAGGGLGSAVKNLSTASLVGRRNSTSGGGGGKLDGLPGASLIEVPKAPSLTAPVVRVASSDGGAPPARSASYDVPRSSSSAVAASAPQKSKTADWLSPTDARSANGGAAGLTRGASVNSGTSSGSGSGSGNGMTRPAVSPLKSALRNMSRTPSPAPGLPASASHVPPAAASSSLAKVVEGENFVKAEQPKPVPKPKVEEEKPRGRAPEREAPSPIKIPQSHSQDKTPASSQARPQASRRSSMTSISSYETVNEDFASADEGSGSDSGTEGGGGVNGHAGPAPPPHDHDHMDDGASTISTEVGPSARASTPPAAPAAAPPPPAKDPAPEPTPMAESEGIVVKPVRRKSVRMSLQPTFSPTPPALDEDDEEHEARWAPWDDRAASRSQAQAHSQGNGLGNGSAKAGEVDMWEDSSDEDEEYRRARRLLMRVGKKEREKGKARA